MLKIIFLVIFSISFTFAKDFSFLNSPRSEEILVKVKSFDGQTDYVFVDGLGREVSFRGWNINDFSKRPNFGFLPIPVQQADFYLNHYKELSGSNIIRWLISWEGIHTNVDQINEEYLEKLLVLLKSAISKKIYVILDYHQDLFSAWITTRNKNIPTRNGPDWDQDGAPKWIVDGMGLPKGRCGKICITWSQNYFTNSAVKAAHRNFWNNIEINTDKGKRHVHDEFFLQLRTLLTFLKKRLTPQELNFILGLDVWNEPSEGGLRAYNPPLSPQEWLNNKLWPFYLKARKVMDETGFEGKLLFAEPSVYWNIGLFFISPRGEFLLDNPPLKGFAFNAHKYDERRGTFSPFTPLITNGAYLNILESFRISGRNIKGPPIISEFGGWGEKRSYDANRGLKAYFQGMELSKPKNPKILNPNFYSPIISSIRWAWDGGKIDMDTFTIGDKFHGGLDLERDVRSYPRRIQGDLMHFYYNDTIKSSYKAVPLNWVGIENGKEVLFEDKKFIFMTWKGRNSESPSEIYIPPHFNLRKSIFISDKEIHYGIESMTPEKSFQVKFDSVFIFDDFDKNENYDSFHFILIAESDVFPSEKLQEIQQNIKEKINKKISPLKFLGEFKIDKIRHSKPNKIPFLLEGK